MKKILAAVVLAALVAFAAPAMAASNPFADVPAGHWSYDAVALLASRGVVSGYPDGQYKGGQLATRYEMASIVARALVYVDEGKASKEDVELVKKLVAEYKNELDALGVKVADLDKRVAGLEKGLKGLRLKGIFWMDAEWGGRDNLPDGTAQSTAPKFEYHRARFFVEKQVDPDTFFQMRVNFKTLDGKNGKAFTVDRLWFSTKLPWDIKGTFGYQTNDWDSEYGLYDAKYGGWGDEDSFWTNLRFMGFDFRKDWGKFDLDVYVGRNTQSLDEYDGSYDDQDFMTYGAKLGYKGEKLKLGIFGRYAKFDGAGDNNQLVHVLGRFDDEIPNIVNYGIYANYKILNGLTVKGTYNHQQFMGLYGDEGGLKNADYWQAIAEADQSLLKLFSLWVQYGQVGQGFIHHPSAFDEIGYQSVMANYMIAGFPIAFTDYQFFKVGIHRDFTKKLKGYAMYEVFDNRSDVIKVDKTQDFAIGFRYQYTPAVAFQLQYDWRDYGQGDNNQYTGKEDLFRFRTILSF